MVFSRSGASSMALLMGIKKYKIAAYAMNSTNRIDSEAYKMLYPNIFRNAFFSSAEKQLQQSFASFFVFSSASLSVQSKTICNSNLNMRTSTIIVPI